MDKKMDLRTIRYIVYRMERLSRALSMIDSGEIPDEVLSKYNSRQMSYKEMAREITTYLNSHSAPDERLVDFNEVVHRYIKFLDILSDNNDFGYLPYDDIFFRQNYLTFSRKEILSSYLSLQMNLLNNKEELSKAYTKLPNIKFYHPNNERIDLSDTHLIVDFNFFNYDSNVNYKGCEIANISLINRIIDYRNFDDEVVLENPLYFIKDLDDIDLEEKIYNCELSISDLVSLNDDKLSYLKDKQVIVNNIDVDQRKIVLILGLDRCIELCKENKEDFFTVSSVVATLYRLSNVNSMLSFVLKQDEKLDLIKELELPQMKEYVTNCFRDEFLNSYYRINSLDILPDSFKNENKDIFLIDSNLDDEIKEKFFKKELSLKEYVDNKEIKIFLYKTLFSVLILVVKTHMEN